MDRLKMYVLSKDTQSQKENMFCLIYGLMYACRQMPCIWVLMYTCRQLPNTWILMYACRQVGICSNENRDSIS